MPALLIKNLPTGLHERLREQAANHHRSMNREVIAILEKDIGGIAPGDIPRPAVPSKPLSAAWISRTTREMRDGRS